MFLLLLTLTLGVVNAGNVFREVQQQELEPPNHDTNPWAKAAVGEPAYSVEAFNVGEETMLSPYERVWCDSGSYCRNGQT